MWIFFWEVWRCPQSYGVAIFGFGLCQDLGLVERLAYAVRLDDVLQVETHHDLPGLPRRTASHRCFSAAKFRRAEASRSAYSAVTRLMDS